MDWKELLQYLKENIQYVRSLDKRYMFSDPKNPVEEITFSTDTTNTELFYNIYIWNDSISISNNCALYGDHLLEIPISPIEYAKATLLWEEMKELYNNYYISKINQFMRTKKRGPKSIEELDDNGNND